MTGQYVEPSCVFRMRRNGWPGPKIAQLLGMTIKATAQAERDQTRLLTGVDTTRIIHSHIRRT